MFFTKRNLLSVSLLWDVANKHNDTFWMFEILGGFRVWTRRSIFLTTAWKQGGTGAFKPSSSGILYVPSISGEKNVFRSFTDRYKKSVHLARLLPMLMHEGISFQMYNINFATDYNPLVKDVSKKRLRWILHTLFGHTEKVYYVMGARLITRLTGAFLEIARKKKVIIRIGGKLHTRGRIATWLENKAFCSVSCVIGVNQSICGHISKLGIDQTRIHHLPGFIPPPDDGSLPSDVLREFAATHSPVLVSSGQILSELETDIWGTKMIPPLIHRLKSTYPRIGLIHCHYRPNLEREHGSLPKFKREIRGNGLSDHILVDDREVEMWPILKIADILVRPSLTDGDSNSVREAIHFGLAVVASDCVPRPKPVVTFPTGNLDLFTQAVRGVINDLEYYKNSSRNFDMNNYGKDIVTIMKTLLQT